jgi:pimeloyl-ACP methyl ester carboxylesterase
MIAGRGKSVWFFMLAAAAAIVVSCGAQGVSDQEGLESRDMSDEHLIVDGVELQSEYAEVNGMRLHYMTSGEGKLILFAHGFPEFWYMWKHQVAEFSKDHHAVALDMRGYNLSSKPEGVENYQIEPLVEDLRALAEYLGHEKFILVAHDWGGIVAWQVASRHPECLEKLIIINAPHPGVFARLIKDNADQQSSSQYVLLLRSPVAEQVLSMDNYEPLLGGLQTDAAPFSEEDKQRYIEAWSQPGGLTGAINYYRAVPFEPPPTGEETSESAADFEAVAPRELLEVNVPTLVIWGEEDTALTIHNLDGLDDFVPDLKIERVPNASHWVVREQPELINKLIRDFIG